VWTSFSTNWRMPCREALREPEAASPIRLGQKVERTPALGQEDRPRLAPRSGRKPEDGHAMAPPRARRRSDRRFVDREQTARHPAS
jgi:hypothetical protein